MTTLRRRSDLPNPHGVSSPCRSRFRAQSPKRISADAPLRLCMQAVPCGFTHVATTAPMLTHPTETWPALIAAVTDLDGRITGAHRTWLDPSSRDKAPIDTPRRAMGHLLGHGVRFGVANDVMAAGEGIETMLSLRASCQPCRWSPHSPPRISPPFCSRQTLHRLYIARDDDPAGDGAMAILIDRVEAGRDRGDDAVASTRRLQRGSAGRSASMRFGPGCGCRSRRRTSLASWNWRRQPERRDEARSGARLMSHRIVAASRVVGEDRAHGLLRGRSGGKRPGPAMADGRLFSVGGKPPLHREAK